MNKNNLHILQNKMAASKTFLEKVSDITKCPICTETMTSPKILPCIHTFCHGCLNILWHDKASGDKVPCPVCRTDLVIPNGGVYNLPNNFFIEKLLEAQNHMEQDESGETNIVCDVCTCLERDEQWLGSSSAENFCSDCKQNMCRQCSKVHKAMNYSKSHQVLPIGNCPVLPQPYNVLVSYCNQHPDKKLEVYCTQCESVACLTCFITKHNGHKCSDLSEVVNDLKNQIQMDILATQKLAHNVVEQSKSMEDISRIFITDIGIAKNKIYLQGEKIKNIVDMHTQNLVENLAIEEAKIMKEFSNAREELDFQRIILESFINYSQTVLDQAVPADVAQAAQDLKKRALELKNQFKWKVATQPKVSFIPADQSVFNTEKEREKILGKVEVGSILFHVRGNIYFLILSYYFLLF